MQKYKVYINNQPEIITESWENFSKKYRLIDAAGGLVYNSKNQVIMIYRNEKWDLPKGKLEYGESIEQCAIREVKEECGVLDLKIIHRLKETYHTYNISNEKILKRTFWFKMKSSDKGVLVPQIEEGITKVVWVDSIDIPNNLKNSYGNIIDLLKLS